MRHHFTGAVYDALMGVLTLSLMLRCGIAFGGQSPSAQAVGGPKDAHPVATKVVTLHEDSDIWGLTFSSDGRYLATSE